MEQTKKINMTAMSDKTNSNTTAKKEEPAWEHKVAMKVSGVSIAVIRIHFTDITAFQTVKIQIPDILKDHT